MAALEVIALDTATPQLRAPGASDTYTFPRAVEMPLGTANGVLYLNGSKVVTSGSGLVFDSSGNLGLGVTPSAWGTSFRAVELEYSSAGQVFAGLYPVIAANTYNDGTNWLYKNAAQSSFYSQVLGQHRWYTAPSGTAGNAISFTQAMTLDASGNLLLGTTSGPAGQRLRIAGGDVGLEGQYLYMVDANANIQLGATQNSIISNTDSTNTLSISRTGASSIITFSTAGSERARITASGNVVAGGSAALATNATDGFLYVPTCAGTPTGTPTAINGMAPIVVNTTNNKLYFYSGGAWRDAGP